MIKKLKKKILFYLCLEQNFLKRQENFPYYNYRYLYQRLAGFRKGSIRDAVNQLKKSRDIDRISYNNRSFFKITKIGMERLYSFFPFYKTPQEWDGKWRISFSKDKDFHKILKQFGFKEFIKNVYLCPYLNFPLLRDRILAKRISEETTVIQVEKFVLGDQKEIIDRLWNLKRFSKGYKKVIKRAKSLLKRFTNKKNLTHKQKKPFFLISDFFLSLLENDPGLPEDIVLYSSDRKQASQVFKKLSAKTVNRKNRLVID